MTGHAIAQKFTQSIIIGPIIVKRVSNAL